MHDRDIQICEGLMVLQDITAVLALSIVPAFKVVDNPADRVDLAVEIGIVLGVLVAVILLLYVLSRYALPTIFKYFALDGEMLFIGTMGFAIGVAGICALLSPNVAGLGAFFSGISIASLPYRLEIEKKCEPLRAFGVVLFFFMLGIDLNFTFETLGQAIPHSVLISIVTLVVSPIIMWGLGYVSGIKARTAFFNGLIVNQISEFGLILGQTAKKVGIFDESTYQVLTVSLLLTFFFSSIGHTQADRIFQTIRPYLMFLDRHTLLIKDGDDEGIELHDHVVLLGFNETGLAVTEFYRQKGKEVYMIVLNPALFDCVNALCEKGIEENKLKSERSMERGRELQDFGEKEEMEEALALNQLLASKFEPLPQHAPRQIISASASDMTPSASFWDDVSAERQGGRESEAEIGEKGCGDVEMGWRVNGKVQVDEVDSDAWPSVQISSEKFGFERDDDEIGPSEEAVGGVDHDVISSRSSSLAAVGTDSHLSQLQYAAFLRRHRAKRSLSKAQSAAEEEPGRCAQEAQDDSADIQTLYDNNTTENDARRRPMTSAATPGDGEGGCHGRGVESRSNYAAVFASLRCLTENRNSPRHSEMLLKKYPGTNIRAVYADPCAPETWHHYNLKRASLVVSCMPDGVSAEVRASCRLQVERRVRWR